MVADENHRWLMRCLAIATTWEEFEEIVTHIRCDQFEGEGWTADPVKSNQLRAYFLHRCRTFGLDPDTFKKLS